MKRLFMASTGIPPERTASQIIELLVSCGARQIGMEYDSLKKVSCVRFVLMIGGKESCFLLPARSQAVFKVLQERRTTWDRKRKSQVDQEQAERVSWRQVYRWVQAQLAMIETGMVEAGEVFMPYMEISPGRTAYQMLCEGKLLEAPKETA